MLTQINIIKIGCCVRFPCVASNTARNSLRPGNLLSLRRMTFPLAQFNTSECSNVFRICFVHIASIRACLFNHLRSDELTYFDQTCDHLRYRANKRSDPSSAVHTGRCFSNDRCLFPCFLAPSSGNNRQRPIIYIESQSPIIYNFWSNRKRMILNWKHHFCSQ